jgi:molecular chaperone DnaK
LSEQGEKFQGDEKDKVESSLSALKEAIGGTDVEKIKDGTDALMQASHGFTQRLYEETARASQSGPASNDGGAPDNSSDDEVVDAEIVDDHGA